MRCSALFGSVSELFRQLIGAYGGGLRISLLLGVIWGFHDVGGCADFFIVVSIFFAGLGDGVGLGGLVGCWGDWECWWGWGVYGGRGSLVWGVGGTDLRVVGGGRGMACSYGCGIVGGCSGAGGLVGTGGLAFWRGQATGRGQAPLRGQATGRGQAPLRGQALLGLGLACWRGQASRPEVGARTCRGKTREGHTHCSGSSVLACCGPGMPGPYERRGCALVGAGNALSAFKDIGVCSMGVVGWLQRPGDTGAVVWRSYGLVSRRQILSCIPIYINSPGNSGFLITCD